MPEELSPESKLYVKEEIEKVRKEIKEDLEKVKSKATKTFTTVVIIVGLITGLGVYGIAVKYVDKEIEDRISAGARDEITGYKEEAKSLRDEAKSLRDEIVGIKTNAEEKISELEPHQQKQDQRIANIEVNVKAIQSKLELHQEELMKLKSFKQVAAEEGYAWIGNIKIIWGTIQNTKAGLLSYKFPHDGFPNACFTVIPSLAGVLDTDSLTTKEFKFQRLHIFKNEQRPMTFVAIGH